MEPNNPPLTAPERTGFVEVNHTRLRVWEWGDQSAPVVLMLHGAYDHGRMFDQLAPAVAALGHHVVAFDARGHGDSGPIPTGHTWDERIVDVVELARHYSHDTAIGLIGHSMGGDTAVHTAAVFPEYFSWIVNIDGTGPPPDFEGDITLARFAKDCVDAYLKLAPLGPRQFESREALIAQRGALNTRLPQRWLEHMVDHGATQTAGGWRWKWDSAFRFHVPTGFDIQVVLRYFPMVECPIMVLSGGEHDLWSEMTNAQVRERVAGFRDLTHHIVAGGGHYLHLEQPEVTIGHIVDFIEAQNGAGA